MVRTNMAITEALKRMFRRVPGKAWLAAAGLLAAAFWMHQHDARIRRQAQLQQLRNQTSAQLAALRRQAAQDVKQANVINAKAIQEFEQRRQQLVGRNRKLAAQLDRLRTQAQVQAGEVATLPISEIATRVAAQLGLNAGDVARLTRNADAGDKLRMTNDELQEHAAEAVRTADMAKSATSAPPDELPKRGAASAENTPHPDAGASTLSPRRGPGQTSIADTAKSAMSAPSAVAAPGVYAGGAGKRRPLEEKTRRPQTAATGNVVLPLTASGTRKVAAALVALNACRAESNILNQQIANCQARAEAGDAALKRQAGSIASLNRALQAKDKIFSRQASEYQAELRAARGTFLGRLARLAEHVAIGVGVGVAIGVAVK
jgi:hypothetical protein